MTDANDLYGLPLDRFVPERTALAKQLRAGGDREEAARVAKLRRPSVAAWAVNQLVRTQRRAISELFDAGDELKRTQDDLVAGGGDADALRRAAERERSALEHLVGTARGLLGSEGNELSATTLARVRETLNAAALDHDARAQLADGCLERELRHVGLGATAVPSKPTRSGSRKPRVDREQTKRAAAERKAAAEARRAADLATRALRVAQQRRDQAAAELEAAESRLAEARRAVEETRPTRRRD